MPELPRIRFDLASPHDEPATSLLRAMEDTLDQMYGGPGRRFPHDLLAGPLGGYIVGWEGKLAVAGGGFCRHEDGVAEIRRMYVVPGARSRGIARLLLQAVEDAARDAGYQRVILDTGPKQQHAEALYRSAGYEDIENYAGPASKATYWGGKNLH